MRVLTDTELKSLTRLEAKVQTKLYELDYEQAEAFAQDLEMFVRIFRQNRSGKENQS